MSYNRKFQKDLPNDECPNCHETGHRFVWMHEIVTYGGTTLGEGLRDCRNCHGLQPWPPEYLVD